MKDKVLLYPFCKRERRDGVMCKILKAIQGKNAQELLRDYKVLLEPPIDLDELVTKMGISIIPFDFSTIESQVDISSGAILGATVSQDEDLSIFYRSGDTENRKRFTIAHEIAHCCLHTDNLIDHHIELRDNSKAMAGKEYEANIFAGELLIPEEALNKVYKQLIVPSLASLSRIFKVSTTVMVARLDYLNMPYLKDIDINEA